MWEDGFGFNAIHLENLVCLKCQQVFMEIFPSFAAPIHVTCIVLWVLNAFGCAGGSDSRQADRELYSLTVEKLRALLKERGLSPKGKKASVENSYEVRLDLFILPSHVLARWAHNSSV